MLLEIICLLDPFNVSFFIGCGNDSFSCLDWTKRNVQGNCVPLSQRCDGAEQCRNGRDEKDCHILTESYIDNDDVNFYLLSRVTNAKKFFYSFFLQI